MTSLDDLREQAGQLLATCQAINARIATGKPSRRQDRRNKVAATTAPRLARH